MKTNKQKSYIILAIIGVVVLFMAGGISYYFNHATKPLCWPNCPGMTDQDREEIKTGMLNALTADWNTYSDNQFVAFSARHPKEWQADKSIPGGIIISNKRTSSGNSSININFYTPFENIPSSLDIDYVPIFIKKYGKEFAIAFTPEQCKFGEFAGQNSYECGAGTALSPEYSIFVFRNDKQNNKTVMEVSYRITDDISRAILSTFKFNSQ